jgi:hypothetical protein
VTAFAAGCAVCGTDIEALRAARERGPSRLPSAVRSPRLPRLDDDGLRIVIALLVSVAAPFIGVLLASWFAWQLNEEGKTTVRNVMLGIAAVAVVSLMAPFWFWRLLHGG